MIKLKNKRLEIDFQLPGREYKGARYDWSSFITDITLDEEHNLTGVESETEGDGFGGKGLCGEFCMNGPLGYDDAKIGDWMPKIGVGVLKKKHNNLYYFGDDLELKPIAWDVSSDDSSIKTFCSQELHNGFAYNLNKKIQINENVLTIDYTLENTGERDIVTSEYIHNYFCFNDTVTDNNYELILDFNFSFINKSGGFKCENGVCSFEDINFDKQFYEDSDVCKGEVGSWKLRHSTEKIEVQESLSKPMVKFAVFADSHIICPEIFVGINVPVGERFSWKREWVMNVI